MYNPSFALRLPNLDVVRETTLKYTNMPEEDAKKNTGHLRDRMTNETLQRLTNTTDAAERATMLQKLLEDDSDRPVLKFPRRLKFSADRTIGRKKPDKCMRDYEAVSTEM
ncbi:hypothetical protein ANN_03341 [Periplaneta americana]|uniref:Uncharacterized protein n=1 Tax=Periplaneta americana TaxID=6978 RepID=A0ABQ8U1L8_PERAM|nr:hypothetical protein ANN_03341 [Periplaneta americana]